MNSGPGPAAGAVVLTEAGAVDQLRAALARDRLLFEPRPIGEGEFDWCPVTGTEPFLWDAARPLPSAKRFFFPARETLLRWSGENFEEVLPAPDPFVLFGLRACDISALAYQDRFFASDPCYVKRRERALIVGLNCVTACANGFCNEVEAGPFARTGYDLNLTPLAGGRVCVETGSQAGAEALASAKLDAREMDQANERAFGAAAAAAADSFPERPYIARAIARINAKPGAASAVTGQEWHALGEACFACTGCSNLCPTCSCFTVVDEPRGGAGERVRHWDSCLLEGFQREASGHHPAPTPGDRVNRFWYHKFSDDFVVEFGRYGCVGCGRCDETCPGSIGATRVLGALGRES